MKKGLLITSRVLFIFVLLFCIFKTFSILADTNIFEITKIEVKDKSEGVVVNNVGLSDGQLQNDIVFSAKDEFVKYNITIKNTSNDDYTIKSITDNNSSTYLEYTYDDLSGIMVNAKQEKTFELQIKYVQEASGLYISDKAVSLTLTYEKENGDTESEVITNNDATPASDVDTSNPNTGDNIIKYLIIGAFSLLGLIITIAKKKELIKTFAFIGLVSILAMPFGVKADNDKFIIKFTTNKVQNTHTDLISGPEFNLLMHKLSLGFDNLSIEHFEDENDPTNNYYSVVNNDYTDQDNDYWLWNYNISALERATDEEYEVIKDSLTEENIISTSESSNRAYMWYEPIDEYSGIIYYYTPAKVLVMNEDSSFMFICISTISNLDLSDFDTINVNNMRGLFSVTGFDNLNLGENFDTSNVTDMSFMFSELCVSSLNLGENFDTSNVTNMSFMFANTYGFTSLDLGNKFDTSNVTDMSFMFVWAEDLTALNLGNKFDTSKVTNMMGMFADMQNLEELDLGNKFNTSNVTNMMGMFTEDYNLQTIYVSSDFDLSSLEASDFMFGGTDNLVGEQGTSYSDICNNECIDDATYARIDDPENGKPGYFTSNVVTYSKLISGSEFNLSMFKIYNNINNIHYIYDERDFENFYGIVYDGCDVYNECKFPFTYYIENFERATSSQYREIKDSLSEVNIVSAPDSEYPTYMWADTSTKTIYYYSPARMLMVNENASLMFAYTNFDTLDLTSFDTSNVTNMSYMFYASSIESINFGSDFDTSNVTDMSYMFQNQYSVRSLDFGDKFDTLKVTNMSHMFAISFEIDDITNHLSSINFGDKFDTSNVTDMSFMFTRAFGLQGIDLGDKFDTSNVTNMSHMFWALELSSLNLGDKFDTSKVTDMRGMFFGMSNLEELNLGDKFDTSKVTNMSDMFAYTNQLTKIYIANDFDLSSLENDDYMFGYNTSLVGGAGTAYDENQVGSEYARIDDPEHGRPGYFTSNDYTNMISGPEFNYLLRNNYNTLDIAAVKPATSTQYNLVKSSLTDINVISTDDSAIPAYIWLDDDSKTLYYYSVAGRILMNEDASSMFQLLELLVSIDLSGFDTRNVTDMSGMFSYLPSLEEINFGPNFDTSNVTDMSWMFYIDISEYGSEIKVLDLSGFDTSSVTNMSHMFMGLRNLQTLDLGDKFDTSNVTDMSNMFVHTTRLQTIYVANDFDLSSVEQGDKLFGNFSIYYSYSYVLVGGAGTAFNDNHTNSEYARIDDPEHDRPGYFTLRQNKNHID